MTDKLREALTLIRDMKPHPAGQTPNEYNMQQIARAALAAAPQPDPLDREALVEAIKASVPWSIFFADSVCEAIADALLARGLRLPGGEETMAWAHVGDGDLDVESIAFEETDVRIRGGRPYRSNAIVRVAIRVVAGGDDAA